jgi:hypothetical protein
LSRQGLGINIDEVAEQLEEQGVEKSNRSFEELREPLSRVVESVPRCRLVTRAR